MATEAEKVDGNGGKKVLTGFQVARTSTADQVAQALQEALLRGELTPGSRVRESVLAADLGVSRNTVREAMRILEQGGLIRHEVNRGAVVKPMETDEVADLYRVRELLERNAVDAVTRKTDLGGVEAALEDLREAFHEGEVGRAVDQDLAFHAAIVALLGSPHIDRFFADLRHELRFCLAVLSVEDRETERPDELIEQHAAMLRALQARDRRGAKETLTAHVRANAERAATLLRAREEAQAGNGA